MSRHRVHFIFHLNKIAHTSATDIKGLLPFDGEVPVSLAKMTDSTKLKPRKSKWSIRECGRTFLTCTDLLAR